MSLSFLRPMGMPRPSTLKHFLGIANASTSASPVTASKQSTPSAPSTIPKPYRIARSGTNNLPVYLLWKRGGNLHQTKVRKIEGNIKALRSDLLQALRLEEKDIMINQLTQQIIIKV
ncbi:putative 54S ribosomal protein IMG2, mitochondrial [Bisporella sp. PMI_857]|nr:putative 54S ribosomal protein IMG2, mitochondrial [Bisporella sp. PMI_857]